MNEYDVIFVGGGLANGLAAYRLKMERPQLRTVLLEKGAVAGGEHTWSFHGSDIAETDRDWLHPFITRTWLSQRVAFPEFRREFPAAYHSIRSTDFHRVISIALEGGLLIETEVSRVSAGVVQLTDGTKLRAPLVIDGRGWRAEGERLGYQKFFGQFITTRKPHGVTAPIIMDATCPQIDGFRFFYVLPWDNRRLLVEDTRYSDGPTVDVPGSRQAIAEYCRERGWEIERVDEEEIGSLPIPISGKFRNWEPGVIRAGMRAGLFHATTGYSFPDAVAFANLIARAKDLSPEPLHQTCLNYALAHWRRNRFFRLLNRMLFLASEPEQRYLILQRFYRLPESSISRFYSGKLGLGDKTRILVGRPPVSVWRAMGSLVGGHKVNATA